MNNFTKEQLLYIEKALHWYIQSDDNPRDDYQCLFVSKKIQSMIDNYCEHEPADKYPNIFKWQLCAKCGEEYK